MQDVARAILRTLAERTPPILVALDGPSGSGKSTIAAALADTIRATVVPSDDFFAAEITAAEWDARSAQDRARDAIDWRRLRHDVLEPLLRGQTASWHPFDFNAGTRPDGTYAMSRHVQQREPAPVILLDGAYSSRPELSDLIALSILVDVPSTVRRERLAARENPAFIVAWHARWDAAEEFYFTQVRPPSAFGLVVDGTATPGFPLAHR